MGLVTVIAIAAVGAGSLALAQLGHHDGILALGLGLALTGILGTSLRAVYGPIDVKVDVTEVVLVGVTLLVALFLFLPGFRYAYGDKDPGIYVAHSFAISRTGDVEVENPVVTRGLPYAPFYSQFLPGVHTGRTPGTSTSQFYHYYSSLLATGDDLAGQRAVFNASPLLAVGSVLLYVLAARRAAGTTVAAVAAALLVPSMMQVWQAKYPSTEILTQLLLSGTLLAAVLALDRRWPPGAFVAGLLATTSFLVRPDGFLYILVAVGALALAVALDRATDPRSIALAVGLALPLPYTAWNAYVARGDYSESNDVPGLGVLVLAAAGLLGAGFAGRAGKRWWARRRAAAGQGPLDPAGLWNRWRPAIGIAATGGFAVMLLVLWYRVELFGRGTSYSHFTGGMIESLDVYNLRTLALFITVPGLALMAAGVAVLLLRPSKLALYALVVPGVALLPIYLWEARISMRLMWWVRRFVPAVLPAIILLIALALAWALHVRLRSDGRAAMATTWSLRGTAAIVTVLLVGTFAGQSLPLRDHQEMGGSWEAVHAVSDLAPGDEDAVVLFGPTPEGDIVHPLRNLPTPLWWMFGHTTTRLADYHTATIDTYATAFPDRPLLLVVGDDALPAGLDGERFELAGEVVPDISFWEESPAGGPGTSRPDEPTSIARGLTVWELVREV